jgi:hypothetical protein
MKMLVRLSIAVMVVIMMGTISQSRADGHGGHSGGGYTGHASGYYGGGYRGYGYGGGYYGGGYRGGVNVWLGGPVWGPGWGTYPYPYAYPYAYPYYQAPPVIINQQPEEIYVQPLPQPELKQTYWYYCENPQGYYPYVKQCPNGWKKIVPTPPAPTTPPN